MGEHGAAPRIPTLGTVFRRLPPLRRRTILRRMPVALRSLLTVLVLLLGGVLAGVAQAADCHHHDHVPLTADPAVPPAEHPASLPATVDDLFCDHAFCAGACGHPGCLMLATTDVAAAALPPLPELRPAASPAATFLVPGVRRTAAESRAWPPPLIHHDHPVQKARVLRI